MLERQDAKEWEKLSRSELELARQAAEELVRRSRNGAPYNGFTSKDKRVGVLDKEHTAAALRIRFPERPEVVRAYAPGYSRDQRVAALRVAFTKDRHGGVGTYILAKKDGRWVILVRDLRYFF